MAAPTIAVVGLGASGIVTVKNLIEEGFEVTGFERNSHVGGLWKYAKGPTTSVLEETISNISKQRGCFTDFPFPIDCPRHPTAGKVQQYLNDYVDHFSLRPLLRLNTTVGPVRYDTERRLWKLTITEQGGKPIEEFFNKVVITNGINRETNVPEIEGIEYFKGQLFDAHTFKKPADFDQQKVLVVGFSNTSADTATFLVGHAEKIFLSHRHGSLILPRIVNGKPLDHAHTYRLSTIESFMSKVVPSYWEMLIEFFIKKVQDQAFDIRSEWYTIPSQPATQSLPIVSDDLVPCLHSRSIIPVAGLQKVIGPKEVELTDGTRLEADSIILCTGYKPDYSILGPFDPTTSESDSDSSHLSALPGLNSRSIPRLYQNTFSLSHSQTLAFVGTAQSTTPAFLAYDLASMAVAQIWKGNSALPSQAEMTRWVDEHHEWVCSLAVRGNVYPNIVQLGPWMRWMNETAGTGLDEKLGYGIGGWMFWMSERRLCRAVMDGVFSPHTFRLFEGKRKVWKGARGAILEVNDLSG